MKIYLGRYPLNDETERKIRIRIDKWDVWNMDHTLSMLIVPLLKELKRQHHGYPMGLTPKKWDLILDDMVWTFENIIDEDELNIGMNKEERINFDKRIKKGLNLFAKHFRDLWD